MSDHYASIPSLPPRPSVRRDVVVHGGDLQRAIDRYKRPRGAWLDLSTGINPQAYPVSMPPPGIWRMLPDDHDDLAEVAAAYYGCHASAILPVAGTQAVIRALPGILAAMGSVSNAMAPESTCSPPAPLPLGDAAVATLTYGEYAPAFTAAGIRVHRFDPADPAPLDTLPDTVRYLVVVNPNNPTTDRHTVARLHRWRETLARRGGTLIVDEAFADAYACAPVDAAMDRDVAETPTDVPTHPTAPLSPPEPGCASIISKDITQDGLIVLRSVGKFFGLAGIRAGFVVASPAVCDALRGHLGAWTVAGPARHAAREALQDRPWQEAMRQTLRAQSRGLYAILVKHGFPARITPLFAWWPYAEALTLQAQLAEYGIWIRCFPAPSFQTSPSVAPDTSADRADGLTPTPSLPSVRIGLPGTDAALTRLDQALQAIGQAKRSASA
ncbi:cobalamin biosynthetic protein CobC [Robbsia andropogonis]|uniref:threonine-phosphate decarboxylase n=1 Tax=Robbsia andropogonis TaxID=28092 RepID=UPI003D224356